MYLQLVVKQDSSDTEDGQHACYLSHHEERVVGNAEERLRQLQWI